MMKTIQRILPVIFYLLLFSCKADAQLTTRVVASNLFIPWELVYGPDNHIWFTQKNGYICRVDPANGKVDTLYHETNTSIQNEGGMLGMAMHPNFSSDPYVYVAYNYSQRGYKERVVRYTYTGGVLQSPQILIDNINGTNIHNGCRLIIINNQLYITTGDAANQSIAQDVSALNGKTLRINLDGTIPNDNPFPGSAVWSWGHRNAQGLAYANNKIYSSEHGPGNDDEFNILEKGRNYGWPTVQGFCNTPAETTFCNDSNVVEPLQAWTPTLAVSGIAYYNHPMFPSFQNSVLMATLKDKKLYQLQLNNAGDQVTATNVIAQVSGTDRIRAVCVAPDGKIYISTSNSTAAGTGTFTDKIIEIYDPSYSTVGKLLKDKGQTILIAPNPATDKLRVMADMSGSIKAYTYSIISVTGKTIMNGQLLQQTNELGISNLASGIYYIKIDDGKNTINTTKFEKL